MGSEPASSKRGGRKRSEDILVCIDEEGGDNAWREEDDMSGYVGNSPVSIDPFSLDDPRELLLFGSVASMALRIMHSRHAFLIRGPAALCKILSIHLCEG